MSGQLQVMYILFLNKNKNAFNYYIRRQSAYDAF